MDFEEDAATMGATQYPEQPRQLSMPGTLYSQPGMFDLGYCAWNPPFDVGTQQEQLPVPQLVCERGFPARNCRRMGEPIPTNSAGVAPPSTPRSILSTQGQGCKIL
jgi:hypothetical protein